MADVKPLSELAERLQHLAKAKHDDSLFTGSEFVDEYGRSGQPLDTQPNKDIATAGGDVQHAYSKVNSVYNMAKNANNENRNEFKVSGEAEQSLNTDVLVADLELASEKLTEAADKLDQHDVSITSQLRELSQHIDAHADRIDSTGIVVVN